MTNAFSFTLEEKSYVIQMGAKFELMSTYGDLSLSSFETCETVGNLP